MARSPNERVELGFLRDPDGRLIVVGPDGGAVAVTASEQATGAATVTQVASSAASVTLQAANAARKGLTVFNDSTAILYLKFGATASATSYTVQVPPGGIYELPEPTYTGRIDGIWSAANGNAYVTETT